MRWRDLTVSQRQAELAQRNAAIIAALRPSVIDEKFFLLGLPRVSAEHDFVGWCQCHPWWCIVVVVAGPILGEAPFDARARDRVAFACAVRDFTRQHAALDNDKETTR